MMWLVKEKGAGMSRISEQRDIFAQNGRCFATFFRTMGGV
jgi:hypothetical protein